MTARETHFIFQSSDPSPAPITFRGWIGLESDSVRTKASRHYSWLEGVVIMLTSSNYTWGTLLNFQWPPECYSQQYDKEHENRAMPGFLLNGLEFRVSAALSAPSGVRFFVA